MTKNESSGGRPATGGFRGANLQNLELLKRQKCEPAIALDLERAAACGANRNDYPRGWLFLQMSLGCYWDTTFNRHRCPLISNSVFVVKHSVK
jgi:hypothetical protein